MIQFTFSPPADKTGNMYRPNFVQKSSLALDASSRVYIPGNLVRPYKIRPPDKTTVVFENNESATAAMFNVLQQMMLAKEPTPYQFSYYIGLYADELKDYSGTSTLGQLYGNALISIDAPTNVVWTQAYNCIYQANAVYEGCANSTKLDANVKKQLMAEALFLRAFWNFYLVNLYGDVPLIITTDYAKNSVAKRDVQSIVYNQIVLDLKSAANDLNENYLDAKYATTTERLRPNKYVAAALLARVQLFLGKYLEAEQQASLVIANTANYDVLSTSNINNVFLKNSKEAIWQLAMPLPNAQAINTTEGRGYILTAVPASAGDNSTALSSQLLTAFEANDARKVNWIGKFSSAGIDYFYPNKYKIRTGATITEYSMVMRVAEQYLIRAEARAQQNNLSGAIADLDKIRGRAGLPLVAVVNPNIIKSDLLTAILHERQVELFTEWGHRWLDLKRTGIVDAVMNVVTPLKGGTWNSNKQYWPLPLTEIQNNPFLKQNNGYN